MTALPEWFTNEYHVATPRDMPEYHREYHWDKLDAETAEYVRKALGRGCHLVYEHPNHNSLNIANAVECPDGRAVVFMQGLYSDPRGNTFMYLEGTPENGNRVRQANRCAECDGIDIWDGWALAAASFKCGTCGEPFDSPYDMRFFSFAGLGCAECARKGAEEFERLQLWR